MNLNIQPYIPAYADINTSEQKSVQDIIDRYKNHPSILKIKENVSNEKNFSFKNISTQQIENEILKLNPRKAIPEGDIPANILLITRDIISHHLSDFYNKAKNEHTYPTELKKADVIPVHKKKDKTLAENYRPVSLIPVVSKLYEKTMYKEIMSFIENSLSPYLFGYR